MKDLVGTTIDRYRIVSEFGRGGMAVVYRAIDTMLDRNVAIKIILTENNSREKLDRFLKRFNREAKTLANLSHPNIVKILDYGELDGMPYLVMEFISGGALKSMFAKPMPCTDAAALLAPVARALQYAHQQKIVHRDVKPDNILINPSGQLMLSDFGILKLVDLEESRGITGTGRIVGTPAYMSPEQIRGKEVDGRADIYSLGIVFFEMITGRKPYDANTPMEVSMQHLHNPIPKAKQFVRDLPAEAEKIIVKAMAKSPEDRFQTMSAFAEALDKLSGTTTRTTSERQAIKAAEEKVLNGKDQRKTLKPAFYVASILVLSGLGMFLLRGVTPFFDGQATMTSPPLNQTSSPIIALSTITPTESLISETITPTVEFTLDIITPSATPEIAIQPQNVAQIVEVNRIDRISVIKMDWVQNGNWLINAGTNAVSFIDAESGTVKEKVNLPGEIPLSMAVSSSDGKLYILFNNNIKVFDIQTFRLINTFSPISGGANSIAVSPDGKFIALGISDNKVQILNTENGAVVRILRSNYGGWSVAFSPDSSLVVGGSSQGILMWETETGSWIPTTDGQDKSIQSLTFSNDGKMLAGGSDGIIFFWDVENGNSPFQARGNFGVVNNIDFSPDNSILVSGSDDGVVRLWDAKNGSLLRGLTGHTSPVFDVTFSPDGQYIASGANEGTILIWGIP